MPSRSARLLLSLLVLILVAPGLFAHDVTISGTQSFSSLDGSASDHDGAANGVFTVNDGNLVVNGVVNCNDDGAGGNSACTMAFAVSGNMTVSAGGALYAENRSGSGNGGAISLTVGGNLALTGNAIISSASTSNGANSNGGAINASVSGGVSVAAGSTIDSGTPGGTAGNITLAAGGIVTVDGKVVAGPSRTIAATRLTGVVLTGGSGSQNGGAISITSSTFAEPAILIGAAANVVSQGENAVGAVTLDGCGVEVRGLVASVSRSSSAVVTIRSGKSALIDGRDLGAAGLRMGRVRADSTTGTAAANRVDLFVADGAAIHGPATGLYAVTSNTGNNDPKGEGGAIRVIALGGSASASGNAIDAGGSSNGNGGGSIAVHAAGDALLNTAALRAAGDSTSNNNNRDGGSITVRSYAGNVIWTNGTGDVRPLGSTSGIPLADQGSIALTACGTVNTTGSSFPVNGTATSVHPQTQTGVCSPAAPSLPAGVAPLVTCNTPPVANDTAAITNEDTTVTITLSGTDADGDSLTFSIVSGPSNGVLGTIISTGPTTATVNYTPNANFNGSDSFVYQANDGNGGTDTASAAITVNAVNDPPSFLAGPTVTVLEDSGAQSIPNWATAISPGPADESGQTVTFIVTNDNPSLFSVQPALTSTGTLTFTPAAQANGTANITITAQDNGGTLNGGDDTSNPQTSSISVAAVNDAPSFTKGADQSVNEDAGPQTVVGWATGISAGPNEGSQTVTFNTANNNNALFSAQPSVSSTGTLTYTPAANANGTATVTISAQDNGGTTNGGVDTSASQTFVITVGAVNDAPSFTSGGDVNVLEDSGAYSANWATAISAGPADESSQAVSFSATNDNNALFSVQPAINASGVLSFTLAANAFGSAQVSVTLSDNGGTANGGSDTSAAQTFTISVGGINDEPSFTPGGNQTSNEDAGPQTVAGWATAISAGPANESAQTITFVTTNDNAALFSAQPSVAPNGTLTYTAAANANGTATVTVYAQDNGGTANGGDDTSASYTFSITIVAVNDAPSFTGGGNVSVGEDSGAYSAAWATAISAGPADESGQALTFNVTAANPSLFTSGPSISATGVLSFTLAANASGSSSVSVTLSDNGGTANGGADTSAAQSFTITVNNINDAPTFTPGANQTSNEDAGPQTVVGWATSISPGPANESGQTVSFVTANDNPALFSVQPAVAPNGTLTYTAAANANGSATVTIYAQDNGGTANGGDDTSASYTFTISIAAVNDPPSFTGGGNVTVLEDSAAYSAAWATAISAGPADEAGQTLTFNITGNSNPSLFASGPSISASGVLSFTLNANAFGSSNITVTLSDNGGGTDTSAPQSFTITVNAVNDAPSFVGGGDVTVNEDSGVYSAPWATAISAGPNESGQILTFNTSNNNNSLFVIQPTISSSGQLTFTPALNAFGSATVTVTLSDNGGTANGGVNTSAAQTFVINVTAVNDGPTAGNDSWQSLGNTEIRVDLPAGLTPAVYDTTPSGNGVRDNDSDPEGDPVVITGIAGCADVVAPYDCTLAGGAKVSMQANGSFSYTPAPGASSGSFQYTVTDVPAFGSPQSSTGTVNFTMFDMIWYVNGSAAPGGNGTSSSPFQNFASLNGGSDVDAPGHTIFVHNSAVAGSIALEGSQLLWGEGVGLSKPNNLNGNGSPTVLVPAGSAPIVTSVGDVVTVLGVTGVEIAGLTLNSTGGNGIQVMSMPLGSPAGATIYNNMIIGAAAQGIEVNAGSASTNVVNINNVVITSTGNGLDATAAGTLEISFNNGTVTSAAGSGVVMNGSMGSLTVTGLNNLTVHGNTAGAGVNISGSTFDAVAGGSYNAVITGSMAIGTAGNPVGGAGVLLSNVSGDLNVGHWTVYGTTGITVSGSGLFSGAAGMRVSNSSGVIAASAGAGLNVANATIGSGNLNFTSISATGGTNGIVLNNTDSAGGLKVTGTGAANSGGTIQNMSSHGVLLTATTSPSFASVRIQNTGGSGVKGTTVTNFSFINGSIDASGTALGVNESNIAFNNSTSGTENNVSGKVTITGNTLTNAYFHGVDISNFSGSLSDVNVSNNTITSSTSTATSKGSGIRLVAFGSASGAASVTKATLSNNVITNFPSGGGIIAQGGNANIAGPASTFGLAGNPAAIITINGNRIAGQSAAVRMATNAINSAVNGKGQGNFDISGNGTVANPITNIAGSVIVNSALGQTTVTATINNNVIVANHAVGLGGPLGISVGASSTFAVTDAPDYTVTVNGNTVSGVDGNGILAAVRTSNGIMRAKVQNNSVAAPLSGGRPGIRIDSGTATGNANVCLNISGNTSAGSGGFQGIGLRKQGTNPAVNVFGVNGMAATSSPGVELYVDSLNPAGGGTLLLSATTGFTNCSLP